MHVMYDVCTCCLTLLVISCIQPVYVSYFFGRMMVGILGIAMFFCWGPSSQETTATRTEKDITLPTSKNVYIMWVKQ